MEPIYLDSNATTCILPEVADAMDECFRRCQGNPSSQHAAGRLARASLEGAREGIAEILGAPLTGRDPHRLIFTSGGTEANNLAIRGIAGAAPPGDVLVSVVEHPSVTSCADPLAENGYRLMRLDVDQAGRVVPDFLRERISSHTRLVSVMLANHETGVLQPLEEISSLCRESRVLLHTDGVQGVGKVPIDFRKLGLAAMSISAHKFHGPVGIGGLLLRHDVPLKPLLFGGAQQGAMRPGTEPVALVVGMFKALQLWRDCGLQWREKLQRMRDQFENALRREVPDLVVHGHATPRLPQVSNVSFPGVNRQAMMMALDLEGIACSTGSACASGSSEPSPVLRAMGLPDDQITSALRFAFSVLNQDHDGMRAAARISMVFNRLRSLPTLSNPAAPSRNEGAKRL